MTGREDRSELRDIWGADIVIWSGAAELIREPE